MPAKARGIGILVEPKHLRTNLGSELIEGFVRMLKLISELSKTSEKIFPFRQLSSGFFSTVKATSKARYIFIQPPDKFITCERVLVLSQERETNRLQGKLSLRTQQEL
jgi:hypothetical protein